MMGKGWVDQTFTLKQLIKQLWEEKKKRVYVNFIVLKQAYDGMNREVENKLGGC